MCLLPTEAAQCPDCHSRCEAQAGHLNTIGVCLLVLMSSCPFLLLPGSLQHISLGTADLASGFGETDSSVDDTGRLYHTVK